jgi:hypothetical protein
MKTSNQHIPISLSKPVLVEASTFRRVKVNFTGLTKGTSLYLSRQYIGEVQNVEGVYNYSRSHKKNDMIFYLGFINTSEQDITLLLSLEGLFVSACDKQKVTYPLPLGKSQPAGNICRLNHSPNLSTTRQAEIITELNINKNQYLTTHPRVQRQLMCLVHKYADGYYDQRRVVKRRVDKQRVDKQRVDKRRVDNKCRVVTNVGYITNTG